MKFISGLCFFILTLVTAASAQKTVPSVTVRTLDGKMVDIREFTTGGKPVVFSFWATWCAPCKKELDTITEVYEEWQEAYGVELIAISIDDQRALAKVPAMVEAKQWPFLILTDANQQLRNALNFQSIPQTFLIDGAGNIVYAHTGYVPGDELELEDQIKKVVEKK